MPACVSETAGYDDVRRTTAARIQKDVRWQAYDSGGRTAERTRELLEKPLDADAAVQIALLNNAGLQADFEELGLARAELAGALKLPNPTADAALRFNADGPNTFELHVMESLSGLLIIPAKDGAASKSFEAARASVIGKILDLALKVRLAFYDYQAAAERLELERTSLASARASFDMAQKVHDAGNVTDLALAGEQALYEEARIGFARAEAANAAKHEELSGLLGLRPDAPAWTAVARLPPPAPVETLLADLERRAVAKSLDLEITRLRYEAAAKKANVARFEGIVPDLSVGVAAEHEGEWSVGPAAAVEVPLFDQGQAEVDAHLAEMRRERKLHAETATRVRSSARSLAVRLRAAADSVEFYRTTLLPLRRRITEQIGLEVNSMTSSVFALLEAKRRELQAGQTYVELLLEYWSERARAEHLLVGRIPEP